MTSQPENSAPTATTETASAPATSQQIKPNTGFDRQPELYAALEAEYLRDATGDSRDELVVDR